VPHRRARLALLALLPLLLGSGLISGGGGGGGGGGTGDITDVFSCTTGDCNNVTVQDGEVLTFSGTGTITASNLTCTACVNDAELASDYSGVGACTANKFVTTLTRNAVPTCTQPNFTDLAGTATAAQTPLATLLAGRSGTGNDTTLSTSADGTLYGSTTTAMDLILRANSADTTTGEVLVTAPQIRTPGFLMFDPDATTGRSFIQYFDGTETFSGAMLLNELLGGTYTMNNANSTMGAFSAASSVVLDWTAAPTFASSFFFAGPKVRASTAISSRLFRPFLAAPTFDANAATLTLTDNGMFEATPTYTITSAGVIAGSQRGFYTQATVGTGATLPTWRGFVFDDATGAGAVTTQVAIDIAALSKASSNMGIRNADTTVFSSGATQSIASGGATTIACSATFIEIDYPTGGAVTVSNNPTIPDSNDGQICLIMNVDSADTITLRDEAVSAGSNLRLPSHVNYAMAPRDTMTLMYSSALSDWIALASSHN